MPVSERSLRATPSATPLVSSRQRWQSLVAVILAAAVWWWWGGVLPAVLASTALIVAMLTWTAPAVAGPLHAGLARFGRGLLVGLTWFLLALVYGLVFTPGRVLRAVRRHDPLERRFEPAQASYLRPVPPPPADRFERLF